MIKEKEENLIPKKRWLAGLLTLLIPGLGHLYIGEIKKAIFIQLGIWLYLLMILIFPIAYSFAGLLFIWGIGLSYVIIVFANVLKKVKKKKTIVQEKYDKWYVYVIIILMISFVFWFLYLPLEKRITSIHFAGSFSSAMSPTLDVKDYLSWKKTNKIETGDICIFEFPGESNMEYIYRCVASPGDKFEIKNGQVYINDKQITYDFELKYSYSIQTIDDLDLNNLRKLGFEEIYLIPGHGYLGNLTTREAEELKKIENIIQVNPIRMQEGVPMEEVFPFDSKLEWNTDFYGPFIIPQKGETVEINEANALLYGTVIMMNENESQVELNPHGFLLINGELITHYTFKQDYYFMMGDNRHNALDSRYKGLVPANLIKGKALYIWWSKNKEKIGNTI